MGRGFLKIPRPILLIRITSRNLHLTPKITDLFLRLLIILKDFIILIICSWYICINSFELSALAIQIFHNLLIRRCITYIT